MCIARAPLENVTSFATRTVAARDYCLVKVRSTDGVEGLGFCYVGSTGGRIAKVAESVPAHASGGCYLAGKTAEMLGKNSPGAVLK